MLCSWLDVFCKTAADVGLPVRGVWNEDSAAPVNFQNAIPLGWGGENAGKVRVAGHAAERGAPRRRAAVCCCCLA